MNKMRPVAQRDMHFIHALAICFEICFCTFEIKVHIKIQKTYLKKRR
mgnify:CR=1 FL=1